MDTGRYRTVAGQSLFSSMLQKLYHDSLERIKDGHVSSSHFPLSWLFVSGPKHMFNCLLDSSRNQQMGCGLLAACFCYLVITLKGCLSSLTADPQCLRPAAGQKGLQATCASPEPAAH